VQRMFHIGGVAPVVDTRRLWATVVDGWWGGNAKSVFGEGYKPLDLLRA
jgi:hypothetical protein